MRTAVNFMLIWGGLVGFAAPVGAEESLVVPAACRSGSDSRRFTMAHCSRYGSLERLWDYYRDFHGDNACDSVDAFLREHGSHEGSAPDRGRCWDRGRAQAEADFADDIREECCRFAAVQAGQGAAAIFCDRLLTTGPEVRPPDVGDLRCDEMAPLACAFAFSESVWVYAECRDRMVEAYHDRDAVFLRANEVCNVSRRRR